MADLTPAQQRAVDHARLLQRSFQDAEQRTLDAQLAESGLVYMPSTRLVRLRLWLLSPFRIARHWMIRKLGGNV
jgi:hypothetical protein